MVTKCLHLNQSCVPISHHVPRPRVYPVTPLGVEFVEKTNTGLELGASSIPSPGTLSDGASRAQAR